MLGIADSGRVLVVGDVMLDRYVHGQVSRISPEAPVPVMRWDRNESVAGGAANVAANIAALGGTVLLASVVGDDEAAVDLKTVLGGWEGRIEADFTVEPSRFTTLKTRFVTNGQQLLRLDREHVSDITPENEGTMVDRLAARLAGVRVAVFSDYRKGVLTPAMLGRLLSLCRDAGVQTIVDPKRTDWSAYRGATVITPNRAELALATGLDCDTDADAELAARQAAKALGAAVLLTRSERGMLLVRGDEPAILIPTQAREVFDVSGAGDTVVGVLALAMASSLDLEQAMRIANVAAGLVVAKRGTATLIRSEVDRALRGVGPRNAGVTDLAEAVRLRAVWKQQGLRVGFTNGCFDIVHPGHVSLLQTAAAACDRLIVAINSDDSVRRLKGPTRPIQNETARATVLGAMHCIDTVVLFEEDTPIDVIAALTPDLLVKGADYREDQVVGADLVKQAGGRVLLVTLQEGQSTTSILARSDGAAPPRASPAHA